MNGFRLCLGVGIVGILVGLVAADPVPVITGNGVVDKVEKDSVTVQPRGPDGRFAKGIKLRVTGTSGISLIGTQKRAGKTVVTQRSVGPKDLEAKQAIAYIYTSEGSGGPTLLSAVVQPSDGK